MNPIQENEIQRLKRLILLSKLTVGALMALLLFLGGAYVAERQARKELVAIKDDIKEIQAQQQIVNDSIMIALRSQNTMSETLVAWTDLLKSKTDVINQNRKPGINGQRPKLSAMQPIPYLPFPN